MRLHFSLRLIVAMAGAINLFQFLRKFYKTFGFYPPQSPNHNLPFNAKNLFLLVSLIQFMAASIAFFLFALASINERADCFYICSACAIDIIHVLTHVHRIGQILQLIDDYEKFIDESKCKSWEMRSKLRHYRVFFSFLRNWTFRIAFSSRISRNEWKNWANVQIGLFNIGQNNYPGNTAAHCCCIRLQLHVFWHGRRFIFATILCFVRVSILVLVLELLWSKTNNVEFLSPDCPSIGGHRSAIFLLWYFNFAVVYPSY